MDVQKRNDKLREHMLQLSQRQAWEATIEATESSLKALEGAPWLSTVRTVYLVGHGTSYATALLVESWLTHIARLQATAQPAFRFAEYLDDYLLDPSSTLVVGISCSGNTASVVNAITRAKQRGATTMIISGLGDNDSARAAHARITTMAHIEKEANVSAYSVSHLFLALAGFEFAIMLGKATGAVDARCASDLRDELEFALESLSCLPDLFEDMGAVASELSSDAIDTMCALGTGPNTGTMVEGALKTSEFCWMFAAGEELEDFAHGRFREVDSRVGLFITAPSGPSIAKAMDILAGCQVSKTPSIVFTDAPTPAMNKLATRVIVLPGMTNEYLTPFLYVFPYWFYGWHIRNNAGGLVGEKRHGLLAVDINFDRHFDSLGNKK